MIWFIIGFIVLVGWIIYDIVDGFYNYNWWSHILWFIPKSIVSIFGSILVFLLATITIGSCAKVDYNKVSDTKIIALKDNQNISGSFYIMGGYVDEDLYYYYATETEFGYKTEKIKADNAYIKYTDGETHVEEYEAQFVNDYVYLFAVPTCSNRYIIYCPEGTVTQEFNVDLE